MKRKARHDSSEFVRYLLKLETQTCQKQIRFYYELIEDVYVNMSLKWERGHYMRKARRFMNRDKKLKMVNKIRFKQTIESLFVREKYQHILFLYILLLSGKRGIDVKRIKWDHIVKIGHLRYSIYLPFDKKRNTGFSFIVDFQENWREWLPCQIHVNDIVKMFEKRQSFENVSLKNVRRELKDFNLHSIRYLRGV